MTVFSDAYIAKSFERIKWVVRSRLHDKYTPIDCLTDKTPKYLEQGEVYFDSARRDGKAERFLSHGKACGQQS
jgi:hypothetical protein